MPLTRLINCIYSRWQIRQAINRLDDADPDVRARAEEQLRAVSPASEPALCRAAFGRRSGVGVAAAKLLYDLGDARGLFALLEQFYDRDMYCWYGPHIRRALKQIGNDQVLAALETSLARIEAGTEVRVEDYEGRASLYALERTEAATLAGQRWSLYVAVYALHALAALHACVPPTLWRRALTAYVPCYEDLRACRTALTATWPETPVVALLASVRRAAVDALLMLDREQAFALLREALRHPDPQVQLTTLYGLRELRDPRAYVLLQPIAANRRHPLCRDARRVIESLGPKQPDVLTLVRASEPDKTVPDELLRPAVNSLENDPETLIRPVSAAAQGNEAGGLCE